MSSAKKREIPNDNSSKYKRGKIKGRIVDLNALLDIKGLLKDESRAKDLLIEHLR